MLYICKKSKHKDCPLPREQCFHGTPHEKYEGCTSRGPCYDEDGNYITVRCVSTSSKTGQKIISES